jgi:hypothetical protein
MIDTRIVAEYRELQALNLALVEGLTNTAEPLDAMAAAVGLVILEAMLPHVPVDTGTLQSSQTLLPEEGKGEAWILSSHRRNPKSGDYADQYVLDVLTRGDDFYSEGLADVPNWVEEAFGTFEAWVGSLL